MVAFSSWTRRGLPAAFAAAGLSFTACKTGGGFDSVSAGLYHTCGTTTSYTAYCWGVNADGRLGNGSDKNSHVPVNVSGNHKFVYVSAGHYHSCGVNINRSAFCWGANGDGQLGAGTTTNSAVPVAISGAHSFARVSAGEYHSCGVTMVKGYGPALCWGSNFWAQLGSGTSTPSSNVPVALAGSQTFAAVSAGNHHICGVSTAGTAYCWGFNFYGQLGNGTTNGMRYVPVAVSGSHTFASVSAGGFHACGVTTVGTAFCWGRNNNGQVGDGTTNDVNVPAAVAGNLRFASVSAGENHTCGVTTSKRAYCWGSNASGQLGAGNVPSSSVPVLVLGRHAFASVSAGGSHSCGVTSKGRAYCWGRNTEGELGDGTNIGTHVPVAVTKP